jgi:hypothetical protein
VCASILAQGPCLWPHAVSTQLVSQGSPHGRDSRPHGRPETQSTALSCEQASAALYARAFAPPPPHGGEVNLPGRLYVRLYTPVPLLWRRRCNMTLLRVARAPGSHLLRGTHAARDASRITQETQQQKLHRTPQPNSAPHTRTQPTRRPAAHTHRSTPGCDAQMLASTMKKP